MSGHEEKVGYSDYAVGAFENGTWPSERRDPRVSLAMKHPAGGQVYTMTPEVARRLAAGLKRWADAADPPKRRRR